MWLDDAERIVRPGVGIEIGVPKIFVEPSVELVGSAPCDVINLHGCLTAALVQVELVGLNGHFLDGLETRLNSRRGVAAELHSLRASENAVNVTAFVDHRQAIPCAVVSGAERGE